MYKQLKTLLDNKNINIKSMNGLKELISYKLQKQLGLKATDYSSAKLEIIGMSKNDKFIKAFASVENLDNEVRSLQEENKIIDNTINDISKDIDTMNDVEKKVFKCRYILGLTVNQTATRLGYGEDRIKQISREITKKM